MTQIRLLSSLLLACWLMVTAALGNGPPTPSRVVVITIASKVLANTRSLRIYLPSGYDEDAARRYPVLYLNDGFAVFAPRSWNAPSTLDALIAVGRIPPIIVVGIDNAASIPGVATPNARTREYLPYRDSLEPNVVDPLGLKYPAFVVDEVVPLINARFRTEKTSENLAIGGSSYGAIAALVTIQQRPGVFGLLMIESAPLFLFDGKLLRDARALRVWPSAIYMGLGTAETADAELSRRGQVAFDEFAQTIRQRAPQTRVAQNVVAGATHTSAAWGERLPTALEHLFGPLSKR